MAVIPNFVRGTRSFFLVIFLICAAALSMALIGEYVFGLLPCVLCLSERVPYAIGGLIALAMVGLPTSHRLRGLALGRGDQLLCSTRHRLYCHGL